jgi:hypothetical protein
MLRIFVYMTEREGNVPNPFLNPIRAWQNYLEYWNGVNRNFYENAIKTNEQWLKALWDPWLKQETNHKEKQ